jgi:hypothetical protein
MLHWALATSNAEKSPRFDGRKLRLFVCACYRVNMGGLFRARDSTSRVMWQIIEDAERIADGGRPRRWMLEDANALPLQIDVRGAAFAIAAGEHADADAAVLRDVHNPYHDAAPLAPARRTPDVVALAEAAYDARVSPRGELDRQRLAVLADALEEAGCADVDLLAHLRQQGPHVRGCWALDKALGRA